MKKKTVSYKTMVNVQLLILSFIIVVFSACCIKECIIYHKNLDNTRSLFYVYSDITYVFDEMIESNNIKDEGLKAQVISYAYDYIVKEYYNNDTAMFNREFERYVHNIKVNQTLSYSILMSFFILLVVFIIIEFIVFIFIDVSYEEK